MLDELTELQLTVKDLRDTLDIHMATMKRFKSDRLRSRELRSVIGTSHELLAQILPLIEEYGKEHPEAEWVKHWCKSAAKAIRNGDKITMTTSGRQPEPVTSVQ